MKKNRKMAIILAAILAATTLSSCGMMRDNEDETEETVSSDSVDFEAEEEFDSSEISESISDFCGSYDMQESSRLCYKSDTYYKIDASRCSTVSELEREYEDAITDIVSTANSIGADTIYYNVEIVTLSEGNKFVVYLRNM